MSTFKAIIDLSTFNLEDTVDVEIVELMPHGDYEEAEHYLIENVDPTDFTLAHPYYYSLANDALHDSGFTPLEDWNISGETYFVEVEKQY